MRVLLTGSTGFIGRHLLHELLARGHEVVCAVRHPVPSKDPRITQVAADFTRDLDAADWLPRLQGVDAVINAVGIIRGQGKQSFDVIHHRAPCALFAASAQAGVQRIVQISALGADEQAVSQYHLSKKQADDFLASLPISSAIVQPSVVYGADGNSAQLFTTLASLPVGGMPGGGVQRLQPVHVDDVVAIVLNLLEQPAAMERGVRIAAVGPEPMTLKQFIGRLGNSMGLGSRITFPVPMPLVRMGAWFAGKIPGSLLDPETLGMLERGNTADPAQTRAILGHEPRAVDTFITPAEKKAVRTQARLNWLLPLLRISIALLWIASGVVSLGLYPVQDSYALLARVGITGALAPLMLYGAAAMDIAIGLGILLLKRRRWLWLLQIVVIAGYSVIISLHLPEFWLHPYGPLLKNIPMLAAILLMSELDEA